MLPLKPTAALFLLSTTLAVAGERMKMGDVPDAPPIVQPGTREPSPEDKKRDRDEMIGDLMREGDTALNQNQLPKAEDLFRQILLMNPNFVPAQQGLEETERRLNPPVPAETAPKRGSPEKKRKPPKPAAAQHKPAVDAKSNSKSSPKPALRPDTPLEEKKSNRAKAQEIYLKALEAGQQGDNREALRLCEECLRLDPDHLQAQRMRSRLIVLTHP